MRTFIQATLKTATLKIPQATLKNTSSYLKNTSSYLHGLDNHKDICVFDRFLSITEMAVFLRSFKNLKTKNNRYINKSDNNDNYDD